MCAQEMKDLLAKGRTLDELWRVAEGKWKYPDYREKVGGVRGSSSYCMTFLTLDFTERGGIGLGWGCEAYCVSG